MRGVLLAQMGWRGDERAGGIKKVGSVGREWRGFGWETVFTGLRKEQELSKNQSFGSCGDV